MSGHGPTADKALDDALSLITERLRTPQRPRPDMLASGVRPGTLSQIARILYRERRVRTRFLDGLAEFGEPAWDILLDLYVAGAEGRKVGVSSACIAACVPTTTALRWLAHLESVGAVERETDPKDGRRNHVRLSLRGEEAMTAYLRTIAQG
ncbi:hypothetical protein DBR17_01525 [Sphingomonas sp. HMWF008]|nr:hypothetical protein DBR17_01525 [Sphingomonas sp. HMWF008]